MSCIYRRKKKPKCILTVKRCLLVSWKMTLENLCWCCCCYPKMKYESGVSAPWMQDTELIKCEWCVFAKSKQDTNLTRLFTVSPHTQIASMTNGKKNSIHEKNKKSDTNRWRTNSTIVPFVWVLYLSKKDSKKQGRKTSYNLFTI